VLVAEPRPAATAGAADGTQAATTVP
jgi:hypothetical protein